MSYNINDFHYLEAIKAFAPRPPPVDGFRSKLAVISCPLSFNPLFEWDWKECWKDITVDYDYFGFLRRPIALPGGSLYFTVTNTVPPVYKGVCYVDGHVSYDFGDVSLELKSDQIIARVERSYVDVGLSVIGKMSDLLCILYKGPNYIYMMSKSERFDAFDSVTPFLPRDIKNIVCEFVCVRAVCGWWTYETTLERHNWVGVQKHRLDWMNGQEVLNVLSQCHCCPRHQEDKPLEYEPYNPRAGDRSTLHIKSRCVCLCRRIARQVCMNHPDAQ